MEWGRGCVLSGVFHGGGRGENGGRKGGREIMRQRGWSHLVPAKRIEIHPQRLDVHFSMRRQRHPVDAQQRPGHAVHLLRYPLDIVDRAQDIARVRARHEDRLGGHQRPEVLGREAHVREVGGGGPPFDDEVLSLGHADPGRDVGFVVEG